MNEGLRKRIITALVLGAALLVVVFALPPLATVGLVTLAMLAGGWEWSAFLRLKGPVARALYVAALAVSMALVWRLTTGIEGRNIVLMATLGWWAVALVWILAAPRQAASWSAALAGMFALVPAWMALLRMLLDLPRGEQWMLFTLALAFAADIGAFFVGHRFGRTRLAPLVSPGKTWEGVLGGMASGALLALAGCRWFAVSAPSFVPLCLLAVALSIVGDLTESLLKRFAGIKDSGRLFPGHGGVMDRIDSVTGAAPVMLFGLTVMGVAAR